MSKRNKTNQLVFAWEKFPYKLDKYPKTAEGVELRRFNQRTMANKAYKAFLKGNRTYKYKGQVLMVPIVPK